MSRYIDSEELWNSRPEYLNEKMNGEIKSAFNQGWNKCMEEWQKIVYAQPTVDVVEVVRCKNCKHRADVDEPNICGVCKLVSNRYCNGNDYCGYGEREEDEQK